MAVPRWGDAAGLSGRERLARWLAACGRAVDDLVCPWSCEVCGAEDSGGPFCDGCRPELLEAAGLACGRCAGSVGPHARLEKGCSECRGRALGFDAAVALGPYQGPIRDLCLRLKREPNARLARWLADLLVEARAEPLGREAAAWVAPVPMHWRKRMIKGYDHADELARALARRLGLPLRRPLRRLRATGKLAGAGRVERLERMRGAFSARIRPSLRGKTVLLVDDILTTGATGGDAARALKRAGAGRVVVVVIGRAEGRS